MKKIIFYSLIFVLLQSCQNEENAYSDLWLYYSIGITDMEGNDLLDPTAEKNERLFIGNEAEIGEQ